MPVLYIREQGSYVRRVSERIAVCKGGDTVAEVPAADLENVAVIGNVQITSQALLLMMQSGITVSHLTYSGNYVGETSPDSSRNIFLRFSQYELYNNMDKRMITARIIVENKCRNQIALLEHHRWEGTPYDCQPDKDKIEEMISKIQAAETSNELMGLEGMSSRIYFGAFRYMLHSDFEFNGRNRRPPKDPVNILLSLAYTFLTREVSSVLCSESFEMYLGFLHGIRYGRKSLALDIVEEFRQPAVDRFVINMCNKRIFNKFDFDTEGERVSFNEEGFKKFCIEFDSWMKGEDGPNFRGLIKRQASRLKKAIQGNEVYLPYRAFEDDSLEA